MSLFLMCLCGTLQTCNIDIFPSQPYTNQIHPSLVCYKPYIIQLYTCLYMYWVLQKCLIAEKECTMSTSRSCLENKLTFSGIKQAVTLETQPSSPWVGGA